MDLALDTEAPGRPRKRPVPELPAVHLDLGDRHAPTTVDDVHDVRVFASHGRIVIVVAPLLKLFFRDQAALEKRFLFPPRDVPNFREEGCHLPGVSRVRSKLALPTDESEHPQLFEDGFRVFVADARVRRLSRFLHPSNLGDVVFRPSDRLAFELFHVHENRLLRHRVLRIDERYLGFPSFREDRSDGANVAPVGRSDLGTLGELLLRHRVNLLLSDGYRRVDVSVAHLQIALEGMGGHPKALKVAYVDARRRELVGERLEEVLFYPVQQRPGPGLEILSVEIGIEALVDVVAQVGQLLLHNAERGELVEDAFLGLVAQPLC